MRRLSASTASLLAQSNLRRSSPPSSYASSSTSRYISPSLKNGSNTRHSHLRTLTTFLPSGIATPTPRIQRSHTDGPVASSSSLVERGAEAVSSSTAQCRRTVLARRWDDVTVSSTFASTSTSSTANRPPLSSITSPSLLLRSSFRRDGHFGRYSSRIHAQQWQRTWQQQQQVAMFHSTSRRDGLPLLATVLKTAASMEVLRTVGRITLTFTPFLLLKNWRVRKHIHWADKLNRPLSPEVIERATKKMRQHTILLHILFFVPCIMFWATIIACLERTPLTGRWRLIILSPEEEEEIAAQLAGPGWYEAVSEILSQDPSGPPAIIHDWRYTWVLETLRNLESTVPILQRESDSVGDNWSFVRGPDGDGRAFPPPAEYPLLPRPRAAESLKQMCDFMMCEKKRKKKAWKKAREAGTAVEWDAVVEEMEKPVVPPWLQKHKIVGPPYSVLVVDKPDASNAFSYGFGPDGGGGIVVYSGFLDDILRDCSTSSSICPPNANASTSTSWFSFLFGGLFNASHQSQSRPTHPVPTPEQTTKLAILLAHELSHLLLAHHLESLSASSVFLPGFVSILTDVARVLIFPITMVFGPFVNDAVAQLGKVGSMELSKMGEYCNSVQQEIEADVVSARLLAHAGYDPREAVRFWEKRGPGGGECHAVAAGADTAGVGGAGGIMPALGIVGREHPVNEERVRRLKSELVRWETERRALIYRRLKGEEAMRREKSSVFLMTA